MEWEHILFSLLGDNVIYLCFLSAAGQNATGSSQTAAALQKTEKKNGSSLSEGLSSASAQDMSSKELAPSYFHSTPQHCSSTTTKMEDMVRLFWGHKIGLGRPGTPLSLHWQQDFILTSLSSDSTSTWLLCTSVELHFQFAVYKSGNLKGFTVFTALSRKLFGTAACL